MLGVEILDQTGNSYRFERGAEESANLIREEDYKHDSDAEEAHQVAAALKEDAVVSSSLHEPTPAAEGTHPDVTDVGHEMISEDEADKESVAQKQTNQRTVLILLMLLVALLVLHFRLVVPLPL